MISPIIIVSSLVILACPLAVAAGLLNGPWRSVNQQATSRGIHAMACTPDTMYVLGGQFPDKSTTNSLCSVQLPGLPKWTR